MFILDEIVDLVENSARFRYRYNLAIGHLVGGIDNHVGLIMEPLFLIVWLYGYVLLNESEEPKDYVNPLQVCSNKRAGRTNHTIGGIGYFEGQLVLVVCPQRMIEKRAECSYDRCTSPKI